MSSPKNSQPTDETLILHIDSATFQAAVTAVMAQFHSNNPNKRRNNINPSERSNYQGNQRALTHKGTLTQKPKSKKRIFWDNKKCKSSQRTAKIRQPVVAFEATTSVAPTTVPTNILVTQIPAKKYVGSLPECTKCIFHHLGDCRKLHCKDCNKTGLIICFCRTRIQRITSTTNVGTSLLCHLCGKIEHLKRDYPTEENNGGTGGV